jgi:hypothetical protein
VLYVDLHGHSEATDCFAFGFFDSDRQDQYSPLLFGAHGMARGLWLHATEPR